MAVRAGGEGSKPVEPREREQRDSVVLCREESGPLSLSLSLYIHARPLAPNPLNPPARARDPLFRGNGVSEESLSSVLYSFFSRWVCGVYTDWFFGDWLWGIGD